MFVNITSSAVGDCSPQKEILRTAMYFQAKNVYKVFEVVFITIVFKLKINFFSNIKT